MGLRSGCRMHILRTSHRRIGRLARFQLPAGGRRYGSGRAVPHNSTAQATQEGRQKVYGMRKFHPHSPWQATLKIKGLNDPYVKFKRAFRCFEFGINSVGTAHPTCKFRSSCLKNRCPRCLRWLNSMPQRSISRQETEYFLLPKKMQKQGIFLFS